MSAGVPGATLDTIIGMPWSAPPYNPDIWLIKATTHVYTSDIHVPVVKNFPYIMKYDVSLKIFTFAKNYICKNCKHGWKIKIRFWTQYPQITSCDWATRLNIIFDKETCRK